MFYRTPSGRPMTFTRTQKGVCTYVCTCLCMCTYLCEHVHRYAYVCVGTWVLKCVGTCTYPWVCVCVYVWSRPVEGRRIDTTIPLTCGQKRGTSDCEGVTWKRRGYFSTSERVGDL